MNDRELREKIHEKTGEWIDEAFYSGVASEVGQGREPYPLPEIKSKILALMDKLEVEARKSEVSWFIDVWNKTVKDGSYPTHAVLQDRLAHLKGED